VHQVRPNGIAARALGQLSPDTLTAIVNGTVNHLTSARSAAEILDGLRASSVAYAEVKAAGRMAKAKGAHDEFLSKVHRAQADLLDAEAAAKRRLADEYDAAQERGELATGRPKSVGDGNTFQATAADIGISRNDIHEARQFRDAEAVDPGITRRVLDERLAAGEEPTKAALREAVMEAAKQGFRGEPSKGTRNPNYVNDPAYKMLLQVLGPCRALVEKVDGGEVTVETILQGFLDADHRQRALRDIHRARDFLTTVLETANAH
jgi:hypothetical protein